MTMRIAVRVADEVSAAAATAVARARAGSAVLMVMAGMVESHSLSCSVEAPVLP